MKIAYKFGSYIRQLLDRRREDRTAGCKLRTSPPDCSPTSWLLPGEEPRTMTDERLSASSRNWTVGGLSTVSAYVKAYSINFLAHQPRRAGPPARIPHERPAHRAGAAEIALAVEE